MKYTVKEDKILSGINSSIQVCKVNLYAIPKDVVQLLELINNLKKDLIDKSPKNKWVAHPISSSIFHKPTSKFDLDLEPSLQKEKYTEISYGYSTESLLDSSDSIDFAKDDNSISTIYFYLEPSRKLNRIFAKEGQLIHQIEYLSLMGITDAIERRDEFRAAVVFQRFSKNLYLKTGILNAEFPNCSASSIPTDITKIHAVHHIFLDDDEIRAGLHVSYQKQNKSEQVLYVCNPETLELAIKVCKPNSTLIIDGHWEHAKKSTHGVWEVSNAKQIAASLCAYLNDNPGKINNIHLWGCEAGHLAERDELLTNFDNSALQFKDKCMPEYMSKKEMNIFRNRARYFCNDFKQDFPFAKNSLAGEILQLLNAHDISLTATPARTYPYPITEKPEFNIASDANSWHGPHFWNETDDDWYNKLNHVKSITCKVKPVSFSYSSLGIWKQSDSTNHDTSQYSLTPKSF